jgi:DNA-(apurinic or apyrimidinic site) lyase
MRQKPHSKTITFSIKMLNYGTRIIQNRDIIVPFSVQIPIDSRLTNIYTRFNTDKKLSISDFYKKLSKQLNIPPIHLDGILWTKYSEIMQKIDINE